MRAERRLVNISIASDLPGLSGAEPLAGGFTGSPIVRVVAPLLAYIGEHRLRAALFIRAAGLDDTLFSVPIPGEAKASMRLGKHRLLKMGVLPGPAAVG